jgi:sugar lactone lactonase YvrE
MKNALTFSHSQASSPMLRRGSFASFVVSGLAVVLTGCGMGTVIGGTAPGTVVPGAKGVIHGGQNPVGNSVVSLMAVGTTGYGSAPVELSTTTSAPITGLFTLPSHVCPTPDSLVYIQAVGGDSGTGTNSAIHLAAVLGKCSTVSAATVVNVDEVTTVAAAYALAPFATLETIDGLRIGTSASNITGLNNMAGPANNLVDFSTGLARGTTDVPGMVLPTPLINTLADILAACVNTASAASTNCLYLDANTTANGFVPSDTFEAAISIAQNPGSNVTNLLTLSSSTAPFQPTIPAALPPTDFTVAIGYNGSGIATYGAIDVAIDATGNAWITTFNTTPTLTGLIEITPDGEYPGGTEGFGTAVLGQSVGVGIDQGGLVWVGDNQNNDLKAFNPDGSLKATYAGVYGPNGQAIDGSGDIWTSAGGNGNDTFQELLKSGSTYTVQTPIVAAAHFGTGICIDHQGYLWETAVGQNDESSTISELSPGSTTPTTITPDAGGAGLSGCAVDHAGNLLLADFGQFSGVEIYNTAGTLVSSYAVPSPNASFQYFNPQELAVDGLGNIFTATHVYDSMSGGAAQFPATVVEFNSVGTEVSPLYGYVPTTGIANSGNTALVALIPVAVTGPGGVAVDNSGNLWLSGRNNGTTYPNYVTEVIGIAAPTVTPKAVAITNDTIASRP